MKPHGNPGDAFAGELFSAALCRGLIEATVQNGARGTSTARFPRLYAAASLKPDSVEEAATDINGFPRLYAAASLKPGDGDSDLSIPFPRFPRLYAAASLKRNVQLRALAIGDGVFRGFMPRPH